MNILYLTYFYPPEVGAASTRTDNIISRICKDNNANITILRPVPNYPFGKKLIKNHQSFSLYFFDKDHHGNDVVSINIPVAKNKFIIKRIFGNVWFVLLAIFFISRHPRKYDAIITSSPPFLLNIIGFIYKKLFKKKWILEVRDLWPDSLIPLKVVNKESIIFKTLKKLEITFYKSADKIICVTNGIKSSINEHVNENKLAHIPNGLPNWIKDEKINGQPLSNAKEKLGFSANDVLVGYVGNVGKAQGLGVLLQLAKSTNKESNIKFLIVGNGAEKELLVNEAKELGLSNVFFLDAISDKTELIQVYHALDIGFVPLRKDPLFTGAVPSKIFEFLALNKYLMIGVEGEVKELLNGDDKVYFFDPSNLEELRDSLLNIIKSQKYQNTNELSDVRKNILGSRNWDRLFEQYKKVLQEVLE